MNFLGGGRGGRRGSSDCRLRRNCSGCGRRSGGSLDRNRCRCDQSRRRGLRLCSGSSFGNLRLTFAGRRRSRGLYHDGDCGRHNGNGRTRGDCSWGSLGHDGSDGRLARDGTSRRRGGNDGRRLPYRRHNLSRFRASGCGRRDGRSCDNGWGWFGWCRRCCNRCRTRGGVDPSGPRFVFLFLGQDGLHHVAGLGDMRQIDFGCNPLWTA